MSMAWLFDDTIQPRWAQAMEQRISREMEDRMSGFDDALNALVGKVQQLIDKFASGDARVQAAVDEANARKAEADAVIADDAAGDAAQDQARADALSAVSDMVDAALNPAPGGGEPGGATDGGSPDGGADGGADGGGPEGGESPPEVTHHR